LERDIINIPAIGKIPDEWSLRSDVPAPGGVLGEAEGRVPPGVVAAFRLLMLTGCRKSEILTLRWEEVDLRADLAGGADAPRPTR